jgi:ferrous iron transport protein B
MTASAALLDRPVTAVVSSIHSVALFGNPNTGKTTVFNRLCGARAKTSNFPGTTTSIRKGRADLGIGEYVDVVDLPGIYDLSLDSAESHIARKVLQHDPADPGRTNIVVVVIDACNLARNLVLAAELRAQGHPLVVALNMIDLAARRGVKIDAASLGRRLDAPVIAVVARRGDGFDALKRAISASTNVARPGCPADLLRASASIEDLSAWADDVAAGAVRESRATEVDAVAERLDRAFTHPIVGLLTFAATMAGLFWTLFALAAIPMDLIEATFGTLGSLATTTLPAGPLRDLLTDGIIGGVAGTVVFLPQICLLFFLISLLEDTGYLARAAFVMDRALSRFGLPGHAFVPLLTSHACALPGIMSTRLIPGRRDRLATILVAPFMSCSARLPVYVLLTSLLFADRPALAGLAFAGCYVLGGAAALVSAWLFGQTVLPGRALPMVLELPSYKRPSLTNALLAAKDQGLAFLRTAGTTIMAICVVMWWLSAYPRADVPAEAAALRAQAAEQGVTADNAAVLSARADTLEAQAKQSTSFAGRLGRMVQPVFAPLGYDSQLTVAVLTSFLAREVFVSTLSVLVGGSNDADVDEGVIARIRSMPRQDGTLLFTPATAASALIFFVLAMQCLPTLAVTRKETGSWRYPVFQLAYMSTLAYAAAFVVYQALLAAGVR